LRDFDFVLGSGFAISVEASEVHLGDQENGYVFEGRDKGHISSRQVQRLLDAVAERAEPGYKTGQCEVTKEDHAALVEA